MARRTNQEIRRLLLRKLASGARTINDLSNLSKVNWHTAERQLNYLCGKGFVKEILRASRVRVYEITQEGNAELVK